MAGYVNIGGAAPEPDKIFVGDTMGVEMAVLDIEMKAREPNLIPFFGFGVGGGIISEPKAQGELLFVGACDKKMYGLEKETGKKVWEAIVNDVIYDVGLADKLYLACQDGCLIALTTTGERVWTFSAGNKISCIPAVDDKKVYVTCKDGNLYAVDKQTGELVWKFTDGTPSWGNPLVRDGVVYVGFSGGKFYAINSTTGEKIWEFVASGALSSGTLEGLLYVPSSDGNLYALRPDGTLVWKYTIGGKLVTWKPLLVENGVVYVMGFDNNLYAIEGGNLRWKTALDSPTLFPPRVVGNRLMCASMAGGLYALDKATGTVIFRKPLQARNTRLVLAGGKLLVACYDCKLLCVNGEGDLQWTFTTSLSYMTPVAWENITPQIMGTQEWQRFEQQAPQETEKYKGQTKSQSGEGSVYSGLNVGYASGSQYTSKSKYVK